jgi:hypothetical protein
MSLAYITGGTTGDRIKDAFAKTNTVIGNAIISATTSGSTLSLTKFDGNVLTTSLPGSDMLVSSAITGSIIYVDPSNINSTDDRTSLSKYNYVKPFATIEAAISAATSGDTVALLSDCEVSDNGVDTVNNIFKNGITITDLDLGVTVSYNGTYAGWIVDIDDVDVINFRILGNISFSNNTENVIGGCIRLVTKTVHILNINFNICESLSRTIYIIGLTADDEDTSYCIIKGNKCSVNQNTIPKSASTKSFVFDGTNNTKISNFININQLTNIHQSTDNTGYADEVVCNLTGVGVSAKIDNIYSNSIIDCGVRVNTDNAHIKISKIITTNLPNNFKGGLWIDSIINTTVEVDEIINSGGGNCVFIEASTTSNSIIKFNKILNTGGYSGIFIRNANSGLKIIGDIAESTVSEALIVEGYSSSNLCHISINELKSNYNQVIRLTNTSTNISNDSIFTFLNSEKITNTLVGGDGLLVSNYVSPSSIVKFYGSMVFSLASGTTYPIISEQSPYGSFNTYILQYKDIYSTSDYEWSTGSNRTLIREIVIDSELFTPNDASSGATLTADTTFSFNVFRGNGLELFSYSGFSGETRFYIASAMSTQFNTQFGDGVGDYEKYGVLNNLFCSANTSYNIEIQNSINTTKGNGFQIENPINFPTTNVIQTSRGIIIDLIDYKNLFVFNSDITNII